MCNIQYKIDCGCKTSTLKELNADKKTFYCPNCGKTIKIKRYRNAFPWNEKLEIEAANDLDAFYKHIPDYLKDGLFYQVRSILLDIEENTKEEREDNIFLECFYLDFVKRGIVTHAYIPLWVLVGSPKRFVIHSKSFYDSELEKMKVIAGATACDKEAFTDIIHNFMLSHKPIDLSFGEYASDFSRSAITLSKCGNSAYPTSECHVLFIKEFAEEHNLDISRKPYF